MMDNSNFHKKEAIRFIKESDSFLVFAPCVDDKDQIRWSGDNISIADAISFLKSLKYCINQWLLEEERIKYGLTTPEQINEFRKLISEDREEVA